MNAIAGVVLTLTMIADHLVGGAKARVESLSAEEATAALLLGYAQEETIMEKEQSPALRDLDYATWHAHIAGNASQPAPTQVVPERRPDQVPEIEPAAIERSSRQAA